ncbi:hypothetical protein F2Q70_00030784 [Brassica cretica]|uniref:Uncharacterized protein n=1 Tax=Brassica cretica TaxID=69181 RepID=A0A8S9FNE3_BRACR|nr:hypothetical protein F2Q70_00030784 [Brassica cretica]KAF2552884.1 hypothetical protein F2Q68_00035178 [Brassica cretica]
MRKAQPPTRRNRVQMRVSDATETSNFVTFDTEITKLTNIHAPDVSTSRYLLATSTLTFLGYDYLYYCIQFLIKGGGGQNPGIETFYKVYRDGCSGKKPQID